MMLPMTSRVQQFQVGQLVCTAITPSFPMMQVPAGPSSDRLVTAGTLPFLTLPQPKQLPSSHQGLHHLPPKSFGKVAFPFRVVRIRFRFDLDVIPMWKIREPHQAELVHGKHPISGAFPTKVASFDPTLALVRMSPFGPTPYSAK
jgi:hypothetical protein